ncbi:MAG TPA: hypothetical protein VHN99_07940 [Deinococcales bacterium]|nr:hypothetical protein [Deinococcales bacterium]
MMKGFELNGERWFGPSAEDGTPLFGYPEGARELTPEEVEAATTPPAPTFEDLKALALAGVAGERAARIAAAWPPDKQAEASLGLVPQAEVDAARAKVQAIIAAAADALAGIQASVTPDDLALIEPAWPD